MTTQRKPNSYTESATSNRHRHWLVYIFVFAIFAIYTIIQVFFTPPLLQDISFGHAYFDRNGELLRITLSDDDKFRLYTPLDKISPHIRNATILYEDRYFYYHPGINPIALAKATLNHFTHSTRPIGASTITMQVARIKYDMDTRSVSGKLRQIFTAIYLDMFYSKHEILEAYLNLAPYGGNIESIGAASLIYFDKLPQNLNKIESITLSTIPQNPTKRGLNTDTGLDNIMHMRTDLVRRWIQKYPSDAQLDTLAQMPLRVRKITDLPFHAPHFINYEITRHNNRWDKNQNTKSIIHTTLDNNLQQRLERALSDEIRQRHSHGVTNAAAILINYKTMDVLAYIGSANYFDTDIYGQNDGVRSKRSPGSTLKPLIYAAATDMGYIHSMTLLKDAKINFGVYAPENADSEFYGPVLARDALTHSRNIPAINLLRKIGTKNFYKILSDSGVSGLKSPDYYGISVALGGAELTMLEIADIYATMANLGTRYNIRFESDAPIGDGTQLLSPEAFFIVLDMLAQQSGPQKHIPFARTQPDSLRHYWKTGTSSSFRDAWTAGIFGDFVLIVWVGNFDGQPNNVFSGAKTAAPIYFSLARSVIKYYSDNGIKIHNNNFLRDDLNISELDMCDSVGGLANQYCPQTTRAYFIPGKSPIETSSVYRAIPIDRETGLRACDNNPETTEMRVFEFWDAEYIDMFQRAGIRRNTPPPFMPGCDLNKITSQQNAPVILSPIDGTRTVIVSDKNFERIAGHAISPTPDAKLFWFMDDKTIGTTVSGEILHLDAKIGTHIIRVIDENGNAASVRFYVVK